MFNVWRSASAGRSLRRDLENTDRVVLLYFLQWSAPNAKR